MFVEWNRRDPVVDMTGAGCIEYRRTGPKPIKLSASYASTAAPKREKSVTFENLFASIVTSYS